MVKLYRAQRRRQGRRVGRGEATCNPSVEDAPPIATVRQRRQRQPWSRRRGGLLRPLPLLGTSHRSHGREEIKKGTTRTRRLEVWDVVPPENKVFFRTGWVLAVLCSYESRACKETPKPSGALLVFLCSVQPCLRGTWESHATHKICLAEIGSDRLFGV